MKLAAPPIRFLALVVASWIGARIWWVQGSDAADAPPLLTARRDIRLQSPPPHRDIHPSIPARADPGPEPGTAGVAKTRLTAHVPAFPWPVTQVADGPEDAPVPASGPPPPPFPPSDLPVAPVDVAPAEGSRWSGSLYLFARGGGGEGLAAGGQLGGGQVGGRIAWRANRDLGLAARLYAPTDSLRAAEGAIGIDLHPLPDRAIRLSIERRIDLGGEGRNAWSAYAAGGFWRALGAGMEADGYAQAGIVGIHARDLFADGAVRIAHRRDIAPDVALRLGAGAWGGAQPGANRLDIGPRAAISLPIAGAMVTGALEGRFRVAGDATPGSGVAFTLATDF